MGVLTTKALLRAPVIGVGTTLLDIELALANKNDSEQRFRLLGLNERQLEYPKASGGAPQPAPHLQDDLGWSWNFPLEEEVNRGDGHPPLSGRGLMANGLYAPKGGTILLGPGQSGRGWVRVGIKGTPAAIALLLQDKAKHVQFIRTL